MRLLEFKADGLTEQDVRRWRKFTKSPVAANVLAWTVAAVVLIYAADTAKPVKLDKFGNPMGGEYDLINLAEGSTIAVLHLYTGQGFDFTFPAEALKKARFIVHRWTDVPTVAELAKVLQSANQLWIISAEKPTKLKDTHLEEIKRFFERGRGVYIWGDNAPYFEDANYVAKALLGTTLQGDAPADQIIQRQTQVGGRGFVRHPIMTGIENLYEGHSVATIQNSTGLDPLIYGSGGNLVAAVYDKNGKRAIIDGGFTRLYMKWDTAGTERYVKNAAVWLTNYRR